MRLNAWLGNTASSGSRGSISWRIERPLVLTNERASAVKVSLWAMAELDKRPVTLEELLVSSLAQTDALAKLLIEKGVITREEFMQKISGERATVSEAVEKEKTWRIKQ